MTTKVTIPLLFSLGLLGGGCATMAADATPDAGGSVGDGLDAGTSPPDKDGGSGQPPGTTTDPIAHFACPVNKPQRAYGSVIPTLGGRLERDETWTPDNVYLIFGGFSTGAHTLTVMPGTVICFDYDKVRQVNPPPGNLEVPSGGALRMLGTAEQPVVLTQLSSGYAAWLGIHFGFGFQGTTTLQHVRMYDAGMGGPALDSNSEGAAGANADPALDLRDLQLFYTVNSGVHVRGSNGLTPASQVTVHGYAATTTAPENQHPAFEIHPLFASKLPRGMLVAEDAVPVRARVIALSETIIPRPTAFHDVGLPYRAPTDLMLWGDDHMGTPNANPAVVTVDAGVTLQIGGMIYVGYHQNGAADLIVNGTAAKPVKLTSASLDPAEAWAGILFEMREVRADVSRIDHAIIEHAGAPGKETVYNCQDGTSNYIGGEIMIRKPPIGGAYAGPAITATTFRDPQGITDGVRAECQTGSNCITTDYTRAGMGNAFSGFPGVCEASSSDVACTQRPLGCP